MPWMTKVGNEGLPGGDDETIDIVNELGQIIIAWHGSLEDAELVCREHNAHAPLVAACTKAIGLIRALRRYGEDGIECAQVAIDDEVYVVREVEDALAGALKAAGQEVCQHVWGIDGAHSNEYCKKCFIPKPREVPA